MRRLLLAILLAAACLSAAGGRLIGQEKPGGSYLKRLAMPLTGDLFRQPLSVHADLHSGEIFVCDQYGDRIVIFDPAGLYLYQIPGGAAFHTPLDIAVFPEGYLLLLAYQGQRRALVLLDFDGKPMGEIGLLGLPEGIAEPDPVSLALSPAGDRLFVLDQANLRIWLADREGRVDGSVDLAAGLTEKEAGEQLLLHVDVYDETILVALPMEGKVRLYGFDGALRGEVGIKGVSPCQTAFPVSAALNRNGDVVVLDQQRMIAMVWRPAGNRCLGEFSGIGSLPGYLYKPADVALDGSGRVYISQGFQGRVQVFGGAVPAAGAPAAEPASSASEAAATGGGAPEPLPPPSPSDPPAATPAPLGSSGFEPSAAPPAEPPVAIPAASGDPATEPPADSAVQESPAP